MNGRFFLDTNVFVYAFDSAAPVKARRANELIRLAVTSRKGIVSFQVVQEFLNVALRRFAHPMTPADGQQYLSSVLSPLLAVQSSPALYGDALRICSRDRLSWYDSLIVAGAIEGGCSTLYSEDLPHGLQADGLRIENPFRD